MVEPTNQSQQPVPVKIVLPRWLTKGVIVYYIFCLVLLAASGVYSIYSHRQEKVFPKEEQKRQEDISRQQSENARREMERLLYKPRPQPSPSPVVKVSR